MNKYEQVLDQMAKSLSSLEYYINNHGEDDCGECYSEGIEAALEPMYEIYDMLKKAVSEDAIAEVMSSKIEPSDGQLELPL